MSLSARWESLSPNAKRAAALGGGALAVVAIAAGILAVSPSETPMLTQPAQNTLTRNFLTDADPRALGMDAVINRLERMEQRMGELRHQMELDAKRPATEVATVVPAPGVSEADREQAAQRALEIGALRLEVGELRAALAAAKQPPSAQPPPAQPAPQPGVLATLQSPPPKPEPRRYGPAPLEELFARPAPSIPANGVLGPASTMGGVASPGGGQPRNLQIRTVAAPEPPKTGSGDVPVKASEGEVYVPAGAIIKGVFLNGLDMPTGQNARKDPTPALIRVKHQAILPNRVRADVRECFLLVSGFGDLASERAHLRGETFSCIRTDGGVIEIPIDGYAVGEDGKVGVRGRVVSKQGALLAKALQAGFLQSFASLFNVQPAIPITPVPPNGSSQMPYQQMFSPEALGGAAAKGVGGAMDRLANYYLDAAEQLYPVIEVDAGRGVEFIMNKGTLLRIAQ